MKGSFAAPTLALALLGAACSTPVSPAGPSALKSATPSLDAAPGVSAQSVPFKGRFAGTQSVTPLAPPLIAVDGSASGNGTHLGGFTVAFPHTVNVATRIGAGTYTFVAADGATLTASFTGQAQGAPPLVSIEEHATVTGGTGRFEGATGSFVVQRQFDQSTGQTEGSFEGALAPLGTAHP